MQNRQALALEEKSNLESPILCVLCIHSVEARFRQWEEEGGGSFPNISSRGREARRRKLKGQLLACIYRALLEAKNTRPVPVLAAFVQERVGGNF